MILKILDYRPGRVKDGVHYDVYEEWNYFDNIVSASNYYDETTKMTVVRCKFRDESMVTFAIPNVAYLMSDTGKTIEKIVPATVDELEDTEPVYSTLQDAASAAMSG